MQKLNNLNSKELMVVYASNLNRLKIHTALETHYPEYSKMSFNTGFASPTKDFCYVYIKCYECDSKIELKTSAYVRGYLENNIDESYYLTCPKCFHTFSYEPNYDEYDNIIRIKRNSNAIIIGQMKGIAKNTNKKTTVVVSKEELEEILNKSITEIIPNPNKQMSKQEYEHLYYSHFY